MSDGEERPKRVRRSKRVKAHTVDSVRESVMVRFSNLTCHKIGDWLIICFKQHSESLDLFEIAEYTWQCSFILYSGGPARFLAERRTARIYSTQYDVDWKVPTRRTGEHRALRSGMARSRRASFVCDIQPPPVDVKRSSSVSWVIDWPNHFLACIR